MAIMWQAVGTLPARGHAFTPDTGALAIALATLSASSTASKTVSLSARMLSSQLYLRIANNNVRHNALDRALFISVHM